MFTIHMMVSQQGGNTLAQLEVAKRVYVPRKTVNALNCVTKMALIQIV